MGPLHGRVALVTGANHGIGAATAQRLASDGAAVLVAFLRSPVAPDPGTPQQYQDNRMRAGETIADQIVAAGGRAVAIEADLDRFTTTRELLDRAEAEFGPVEILVNNATGWAAGDSFASGTTDVAGRTTVPVTPALFDATFRVDALACALLIAGVAERHIAAGRTWGRIIGLTSGGPTGFPNEVTYGAAKAAQENYTMSAATELAAFGITANMVHPPVTDTGWVTDTVRSFVASSPDHVHVADPADVAGVIAWLCTDEARMVTGNIIRMR